MFQMESRFTSQKCMVRQVASGMKGASDPEIFDVSPFGNDII